MMISNQWLEVVVPGIQAPFKTSRHSTEENLLLSLLKSGPDCSQHETRQACKQTRLQTATPNESFELFYKGTVLWDVVGLCCDACSENASGGIIFT